MATVDARRRRVRTLLGGVVTSVFSRGLAALTPLLLVPISLDYLGAEGYGAWSAALAVTSLMLFADLGLGTGLMTRLGQLSAGTPEDGGRHAQLARAYVTNAYVMAAFIVVLGWSLLLLTTQVVPWARFLGADDPHDPAVSAIAVVTLAAFLGNIVASLVVRIQYGIGQQAVSNIWQGAASITSLGAALLAVKLDVGPGAFVAWCAFAPVGIASLNTATFFLVSQDGRRIRPSLHLYSSTVLRELLRLGSRFLLVTVLLTICTQIDPWLVAHTAALADVPTFAVPARIFALIGTLTLTLTQPLWPLHAQALAHHDVEWVSTITRRMTVVTLSIVAAAGAIAVWAGPAAVDIWLQSGISREPFLWAGLAVWWFVQAATGPAFMAQNGAEVLAPQTIGYTVLLVSLPLKWWVAQRHGFVWIPWVGAAAFVACIWPACLMGYRGTLRKFRLSDPPLSTVGGQS
ncbi:hypothetical protein KMZ32_18445 [Phycicoccus sp. MAQZ13P-2]|uniref:oligosaccharide flippase family protein n=1 Tax=Phycicoccus mangrovi TaxID=2840470 RepID=UPI001C000E72|nr:oligosaccharide flippase family protein [Phycicoccus mangrovi]MBT9257619.1 hypothetical protein [Phycicoccus mangrovi]MBT9276058.1 hypothetical protein [Phycicoccus mangrovi]